MIVEQIPLAKIEDNPFQPRRDYDPEKIRDLAKDIRRRGLLQPPVGRRMGNGVQLAFGHRRLRAFRLLAEEDPERWGRMPVEIRALSDPDMALYAWSENEARADLNPVERAEAIRRMMDAFGWTQRQVATRLGMSRSAVANTLRLLRLPEEAKRALAEGRLSERQAAALVPFYDLPEAARQRALEWWSGRQIQEVVAGKKDIPSDELRRLVREAIHHGSKSLAGALFPTEDCEGCEHNLKGRCSNPECFDEKQRDATAVALRRASERVGVPALPLDTPETDYKQLREGELEQARARACPNLRVAAPRMPWGVEVVPGAVVYVCYHQGAGCKCHSDALRHAEAEKARKAAAVQQARDRLTEKVVIALRDNHPGAWRAVLYACLATAWEQDKAFGLDDNQALRRVAAVIVEQAGGRWPPTPEDLEAAFEEWRERIGLDLPEDDPFERARLRWLRLRRWVNKLRYEYPTPEAVRGNIINLQRLHDELTTMAQDGRPEAGPICADVSNLMERLQAILPVVEEARVQDKDIVPRLLNTPPDWASFSNYAAKASDQAIRYVLALIRGQEEQEERVAALERELERRNGQS